LFAHKETSCIGVFDVMAFRTNYVLLNQATMNFYTYPQPQFFFSLKSKLD
jgi:hypothetical protein